MKDYITDIKYLDLVQYAYDQGYKTKTSGKLSSTWISLKNKDTGDSIRIKTKPLPMYYNNNNLSIDNDRGDIINFVINRLNHQITPQQNPSKQEFGKAIAILKEKIGVITLDPKDFVIDKKKSDTQKLRDQINSLKFDSSLIENYFSKHRAINPLVLEHPFFKNTIAASPLIMKSGKVIHNTAFLKRDVFTKKIIGFTTYFHSSKENKSLKRIFTKQNIPYHSNIDKDSKNIIVGESEIDCLSHFELFKPENAVYISPNGAFSPNTLKHINDVYNVIESSSKSITSITDNDINGYGYDLKMAIHFNNIYNPSKPIEIIQKQNETKLIFHSQNELSIDELQKQIKTAIEFQTDSKQHTGRVNIAKTKDYIIVEMNKTSLHNIYLHLKPLSKFIFDLTPIRFYNHKSKLKDWNDELQQKKNTKTKKKLKSLKQ